MVFGKNKTLYRKKKWLNSTSTAYIYADITTDTYTNSKHKVTKYHYGTLKMGDCYRIVSFDIELETVNERKATIKKLDIIIDEVLALRNKIVDIHNEK